MGISSVWQNGPDYINLPLTEWPISRKCLLDGKYLPDKIRIVMSVDEISVKTKSNPNLEDTEVQKYHNIDKLYKVISLRLLVGKR